MPTYTATTPEGPVRFDVASDLDAAQWVIDRYNLNSMCVIECDAKPPRQVRVIETFKSFDAYDMCKQLVHTAIGFTCLLQKDEDGEVEVYRFVTSIPLSEIKNTPELEEKDEALLEEISQGGVFVNDKTPEGEE